MFTDKATMFYYSVRGVFVKKAAYFCFFIFLTATSFASKLDINIIYEASSMKVKETVCGWQPDLSKGYIDAGEDCYTTGYTLDVPMFGFTFEPISGPLPQAAKVAYYLSFFDSVVPTDDHVKTEIIKDGSVKETIKGVKHDRTFQGLAILDAGETIRFTSKNEPSYYYIYIIAVLFVGAGVFLILRKKG
jgi:hypothetical protein